MRRGTSYLLLSVLLLLAVAVAVSACGSDDGATTTSAAATTTSAAATTTSPTSPATTSTPDTTAPASTDTTAAAKPVELKMASMHAPTSPSGAALEAWAERIKEASNGLLTIRHYGSSQLIPGPEMREGIKSGLADLGNSFIFGGGPGFEVGVNLTQLVRGKDILDGVRIFDEIWAKYTDLMESQWKDYKLLWIVPTLATVIYTTEKPVRTMEDIKGLELRVPNAILADFMKNLGAAPISMSTPDWITSLDKGTTDGGATTVGSMYDFQIAEKFKYSTNFAMGCSVNYLIMNMDSWNKLSPELQKVIDDSLEEARQEAIDTWLATEKLTHDFSVEKGIQFIELTDEEYARWNAAVRPVYDKMAADMDAAGYPGTELVNFALGLAR
jgi:TRAP-type C4-dicarboxylate transport system substrate-binding protein